ncbi:MAG: CDP-alcohol phosphatidyltransferase family protein [Geminicoccaceae bacterium]|nr:CDP-alcohol phosphatidyltransferase family protein [Geminicoccaceae bacterium]
MAHVLPLRHAANLVTAARLGAAVPLVLLIERHAFDWAFLLFLVAAASDAVDGVLARLTGSTSTLGAALDPIADKTLIALALLSLWWVALVPTWFILLLMFRDVAIVASSVALYLRRRALRVEPLAVGKLATALQLVLVGFVLLEQAFDLPLAELVGIGFPAVAGVAWAALALTAYDAWQPDRSPTARPAGSSGASAV